MHATLHIHPTDATPEGCAPVDLRNPDGTRFCELDLQYSKLAHLPVRNAAAVDLLLLATAAYALDKLVLRSDAADAWTRKITLTVPVSDTSVWGPVNGELTECLNFLTGDVWTLEFVRRSTDPVRRLPRKRQARRKPLGLPKGDAVSLFSGGLDSLIGVIDYLAADPSARLLFVGHHERAMPGPYSQQKGLLKELQTVYPKRMQAVLARAGHGDTGGMPTEITLRGRSFMFVALGVFAASALGPRVPLLIPENGTIALNVPLTPSRRGSCSTRTAHPFYLGKLGAVLAKVGLGNPIINPLEGKTKGEAVVQCLNAGLLKYLAPRSVSCAKTGHTSHWTRQGATSCGRCMPCIYRRAALHAAGWDTEVYGDDICLGEVDLADPGEKPNDLRACFGFLRKRLDERALSSLLMASGSIEASKLGPSAAMVGRTMEEIRRLIRDKGTAEMKRLAGV